MYSWSRLTLNVSLSNSFMFIGPKHQTEVRSHEVPLLGSLSCSPSPLLRSLSCGPSPVLWSLYFSTSLGLGRTLSWGPSPGLTSGSGEVLLDLLLMLRWVTVKVLLVLGNPPLAESDSILWTGLQALRKAWAGFALRANSSSFCISLRFLHFTAFLVHLCDQYNSWILNLLLHQVVLINNIQTTSRGRKSPP